MAILSGKGKKSIVINSYETLGLPDDLDYRQVRGLSIEVQQKLKSA